jgi:hypothetical protein
VSFCSPFCKITFPQAGSEDGGGGGDDDDDDDDSISRQSVNTRMDFVAMARTQI